MRVLGAISLLVALCLGGVAVAGSSSALTKPAVSIAATSSTDLTEQWRVEGEKRYRFNCGRCHQAPQKLSPRTMATAVRHMRVRAMLTDDDMKYVLYYMTH
jgi:cytochrome c5